MRKFLIVVALMLGLTVGWWAAEAQTQTWWMVQTDRGIGITAGTVFPSATSELGMNPADGMLHIDLNSATANPVLYIYSGFTTAWVPVSAISGAGQIPTTLATNAVDVVNSIWGGTNQLIFEGGTADTGEFILTWTNSATDVTITIPADNADWAGTGSFMITTLATNAPDAANSVTGGTNQLIFEGATANAFEIIFEPADTTGDVVLTLPSDNADWAGTGAPMISTLVTNAPDIANSVTGANNALVFEGATANAFELTIVPGDVGQDLALTIDDYGVAAASLIPVLAATNVPQAANSVWLNPATGVTFEGATVDAFEIVINAADSTVGVDTYQFPDRGLAAATYGVHASNNAYLATRTFMWPPFNEVATVAHTSDANNDMYCHRVPIPYPITVANIAVWLEDGGALAAADIVGAAIYYDADAGVQIATGTGDGTAAGVEDVAMAAAAVLQPDQYRVCICTSDATNMLFGAIAPAGLDNDWEAVMETTEVEWGVAANPCVVGVPPATTGALAGDDEEVIFFKLH